MSERKYCGRGWAAPILIIFLAAGVGPLRAQSAEESGLAQARERLTRLEQQSRLLSTSADSLAQQINELKRGEPRSFFARRRLEQALRRAQDLSHDREENLTAQAEVRTRLQRLARALDERYTVLIDSLWQAVEPAAPPQRQELALRVEQLRGRRASLQGLLAGRPDESAAADGILISPGDLPDEIAAKAALLREREKILREQIALLERRRGQLRQEAALRRKMADLVADVSLFEPRDETAQRLTRTPGTDISVEGGDSRGQTGMGTLVESPLNVDMAATADPLLRPDVRLAGVEDSEQRLQELEIQRRAWLQRADSLALRARQFDDAAARLRATLQQKH